MALLKGLWQLCACVLAPYVRTAVDPLKAPLLLLFCWRSCSSRWERALALPLFSREFCTTKLVTTLLTALSV